MAEEFGGKFSPKPRPGAETVQKPVRAKAGVRARLMFFAPVPLLFSGFGGVTSGDITVILRDFLAFAILILAAWMLREGLKAEAAFDARDRAHRPALPRKIIAADLVGIGVGLAAWGGFGTGLAFPVVVAILVMALHLIAFGIDPLKSKGEAVLDTMQGKRAARAIDAAEDHITAMTDAMATLGDRQAKKQLDEFVASARAMFRLIEDDPRDLVSARKYLSVYVKGARDATEKFVDLFQKTADAKARDAYMALLVDLSKNFKAGREELLLDDRSDLDVEIEVLRDRLRYEGVET